MNREMLLESVAGQVRLAVVEDNRLCEIYYERRGRAKLAGNIYAGRVQNVLPGMNAAFVDIGLEKNAFLYAGDLCFDTRGQDELQKHLADRRIEKMIRPGQMITVQVVKEPGGSKGPRVSGSIALPGRYCVAMPGISFAGVSKKIEDEAERERLYCIANDIAGEHRAGVIIRTAGEGAGEDTLRADFENLMRMCERIEREAAHSAVPRLIESDGSLCVRMFRDLNGDETQKIKTDDRALYDELRTAAKLIAPEYKDRIEFVDSQIMLFDAYRIDHQLEDAFKRHVWLKSGGSIVIDETEALTVIDVNTGKYTGKKSLEETLYAINMEAADEIVRQLRLRDVGGIVIIDFIDMKRAQDRENLLTYLGEALRRDMNHTQVMGMTQLGLVEMTRRKVRTPLKKILMHDCCACRGFGSEFTFETIAYQAIREVIRRRRAGDTTAYKIKTGEKTAGWIKTIGFEHAGATAVDASGTDGEYTLLPV